MSATSFLIIFTFLFQCSVFSFEGDFEEPLLENDVIAFLKAGRLFCTGVVLDEYTIITAKHCFSGMSSEKQLRKVKLQGRPEVRVLEILNHANLDVALIKTTKLLVSKSSYKITTDSIMSGDEVIIGAIGNDGSVVFGQTRVRSSFGALTLIEEGPIYLCHGDSGAPVFVRQNDKYLLTGIVLRGEEGCYGKGTFLNLKEIF